MISRRPIFTTFHCALVVSLAAVAFAPPTAAETIPMQGTGDRRLRLAEYKPDEVYRLHGYVGYQISFEFEPGETYTGTGGGDLEGITLGAFENHLILKPRAPHVGTNLLIFTNRRHYHIEYTASSRRPNPHTDEIIYAVRFLYPPVHDPAAGPPGPTSAQLVEQRLSSAKTSRQRNMDYWFCGHPAVKPVAASDDGIHTRLTFGSRAELPAVFVLNDDKSESRLSFRMDAGDVVIHRVARQLIVRRGRLVGCIVNRGFEGSGQRLESGTVAPTVTRDRRGQQHRQHRPDQLEREQ